MVIHFSCLAPVEREGSPPAAGTVHLSPDSAGRHSAGIVGSASGSRDANVTQRIDAGTRRRESERRGPRISFRNVAENSARGGERKNPRTTFPDEDCRATGSAIESAPSRGSRTFPHEQSTDARSKFRECCRRICESGKFERGTLKTPFSFLFPFFPPPPHLFFPAKLFTPETRKEKCYNPSPLTMRWKKFSAGNSPLKRCSFDPPPAGFSSAIVPLSGKSCHFPETNTVERCGFSFFSSASLSDAVPGVFSPALLPSVPPSPEIIEFRSPKLEIDEAGLPPGQGIAGVCPAPVGSASAPVPNSVQSNRT